MANEFKYDFDFDTVKRALEFFGRYVSQMGSNQTIYLMAYGFITVSIMEAKNKEDLR